MIPPVTYYFWVNNPLITKHRQGSCIGNFSGKVSLVAVRIFYARGETMGEKARPTN